MKRIFILGMLALFTLQNLHALQTKTIDLVFKADNFALETTDEGCCMIKVLNSIGFVYKEDSSMPALPYKCVYVLIGPEKEFEGFELENEDVLMAETIVMAPNPTPMPTNIKGIANQQSEKGFSQAMYPTINIEYTGTHSMGGYRFLSFLVCPFKYDVTKQKLFICTDMRMKISMTESGKKTCPSIRPSEHDAAFLSSLVVNPEDIQTLYPCASSSLNSSNRSQNDYPTFASTPLKYLIITRDSLRAQFQRLANWKITRGVKTQVITVEDIYNAYAQTSDSILKIKYAISDYYNNFSNGNLQYVLLGGGKDVVPIQNCYAKTSNDSTNAPCDYFYACLQNINWNTNGNNKVGEVEDNISICPTVALSRIPVSTVTEARNMVDRIIAYERYPNIDNWKNEMLMCAACTETCDYNGQTVSWFHATSEKMYQSFISNSLWDGSKYRFYDTGTDHPMANDPTGASYDVTRANLCNEMKKGYSFVNINTHGFQNFYTLEGNSFFQYSDADTISNTNYSIIVTEACHTNDFGSTLSLGTHFINNPNGGVLAYYGSSDLAWGYQGGNQGPIDNSCGAFFLNLFDQSKHLGDAMKLSKAYYLSDCTAYGLERWNLLFQNMLGDPEMPVYTSLPSKHDNVVITHNGNYYRIEPHTYRGHHCVMSRLDNGSTFYDAGDDNYSTLDYNNLPGEFLVCITSNNKIPYRTIMGNTVYLQNESLYDNLNVVADNTIIGSNVVSDRPTGNVVVENGHSVIDSRFGVTIMNNFKVLPGASLEIITNTPQNY